MTELKEFANFEIHGESPNLSPEALEWLRLLDNTTDDFGMIVSGYPSVETVQHNNLWATELVRVTPLESGLPEIEGFGLTTYNINQIASDTTIPLITLYRIAARSILKMCSVSTQESAHAEAAYINMLRESDARFIDECSPKSILSFLHKIPQAAKFDGKWSWNSLAWYLGLAASKNIPCLVRPLYIFEGVSGQAFSCNPVTGEEEIAIQWIHGSIEQWHAGNYPVHGKKGLVNASLQLIENMITAVSLQAGYPVCVEFSTDNAGLKIHNVTKMRRSGKMQLSLVMQDHKDKKITDGEAVTSVSIEHLETLMSPMPDLTTAGPVIGTGMGVNQGIATGILATDPATINDLINAKEPFILIRESTKPEDLPVMQAAVGIVTLSGGPTSHAAVIAKQLGKPCIVSCKGMPGEIGTVASIDGQTGNVYSGHMAVLSGSLDTEPEMQEIIRLAAKVKTMKVYANADTPAQAEIAIANGAEGIGLLRTEHMFTGERTKLFWQVIGGSESQKKEAMKGMRQAQILDFVAIFKIMAGRPIAVRLLDPPLHEFLPSPDIDMKALKAEDPETWKLVNSLKKKAATFHEDNPMLGMRGARLGIKMPEIYQMQIEAIRDAITMYKESNSGLPEPEITIIIPMVTWNGEVIQIKSMIASACEPNVKIGVMMEVPRIAVNVMDLCGLCDSIHWGTNDLTQMTLGLSRDDTAELLQYYSDIGIVHENPFVELDDAVVELMLDAHTAISMSELNWAPSIGVCGEHASNPESIWKLQIIGANYISVSPSRVPVAILAAGQAAVKDSVMQTALKIK